MPDLTRELILSEPAGPRMDRWVAERVMGWRLVECDGTPHWDTGIKWTTAHGIEGGEPWDYMHWGEPPTRKVWHGDWQPSTNILAAWSVVEKMASVFPGFELMDWPEDGDKRWLARFGNNLEGGCPEHVREVEADTAPLAICRAALLAQLESTNA